MTKSSTCKNGQRKQKIQRTRQDVTGPRVADVCKRASVQLCLHYSLQDLQSELSIPELTE